MENKIQHDLKAANNIGQKFLKYFFNPDTDISLLYGGDSILNFESETFIGKDDIVKNIKNLKVSNVQTNYSIQPSSCNVLVFLSGNLKFFGDQDKLPFIRCILLVRDNDIYYIKNDILKMSFK